MKADFLFVGWTLNAIVQEKTPETCTFHGWWFENKEHQKCNVETRLLFSAALIKFLATRLVPLPVFTKRSCALFLTDLCGDWVAVYFIYRNWPSLNSLSQFLSIIVSIYARGVQPFGIAGRNILFIWSTAANEFWAIFLRYVIKE